MAISGKCTKITIKKDDGSELDLSPYVASIDLSLAENGTVPPRMTLPAFEVSFTIGSDSEFAKALRRYLRRKWTIAWLEQFAAWAFGRN